VDNSNTLRWRVLGFLRVCTLTELAIWANMGCWASLGCVTDRGDGESGWGVAARHQLHPPSSGIFSDERVVTGTCARNLHYLLVYGISVFVHCRTPSHKNSGKVRTHLFRRVHRSDSPAHQVSPSPFTFDPLLTNNVVYLSVYFSLAWPSAVQC
jgi:hypothetical protein